MESQRIEFTLEEDKLGLMLVRWRTDATTRWTRPRLWCCHSLTVSASSSEATIFQLPPFFSRVFCNWAARGSLLETNIRFVLHFTTAFRVFNVFSQLSQTRVKAFSGGAKQNRTGNFHRWNASRMRRELTRALISQSVQAHYAGRQHWNPHQYQTCSLLAYV